MLLFCGFAPLFLHYGWAAWDVVRLGPWPLYTPFAPWGATLMTECCDPSNIRNVGTTIAIASLAVAATGTSEVARLLTYDGSGPNSEYELSYLFMWCGFSALNFYFGCKLLFSAATESPLAVYYQIFFQGRLIAGGSGAFLLLVFLVPILIKDLHFVTHPYAAGTLLTSIAWLGFGVGYRPCNNRKVLKAAPLFPVPRASRSY